MRWMLLSIIPLVQDRSLDLLTSSPACYYWATDAPDTFSNDRYQTGCNFIPMFHPFFQRILFISCCLERGTKPIRTPYDSWRHFILSGIRTCDHPHGRPQLYRYATGVEFFSNKIYQTNAKVLLHANREDGWTLIVMIHYSPSYHQMSMLHNKSFI